MRWLERRSGHEERCLSMHRAWPYTMIRPVKVLALSFAPCVSCASGPGRPQTCVRLQPSEALKIPPIMTQTEATTCDAGRRGACRQKMPEVPLKLTEQSCLAEEVEFTWRCDRGSSSAQHVGPPAPDFQPLPERLGHKSQVTQRSHLSSGLTIELRFLQKPIIRAVHCLSYPA